VRLDCRNREGIAKGQRDGDQRPDSAWSINRPKPGLRVVSREESDGGDPRAIALARESELLLLAFVSSRQGFRRRDRSIDRERGRETTDRNDTLPSFRSPGRD